MRARVTVTQAKRVTQPPPGAINTSYFDAADQRTMRAALLEIEARGMQQVGRV